MFTVQNNIIPQSKNRYFINRKCKKRLLFRIGIDAGFFSEYNNMIITLHYCLINKIEFILNSNEANFSFNKGWQDYFLPFTRECRSELNKLYNNRFIPPLMIRQRDKFGFGIFMFWLVLGRYNYATWQILPAALKQKVDQHYSIPDLGLEGTLFENCCQLSKMVWRYQPIIQQEINRIKDKVPTMTPYVGFHIRKGDKIKESKLVPTERFIIEAEKRTNLRTGFISTDDYTVVEELNQKYPNWVFFTLTTPKERGYCQNDQTLKKVDQIRIEMIRLFAEIELLTDSEYFFGTYSSNVSLNIAMRRQREKCIGVDFDEWRIII